MEGNRKAVPPGVQPPWMMRALREGAVIHLVSGLLWFVSAVFASMQVWGLPVFVLLVGAFIAYPLTSLVQGRKARRTSGPGDSGPPRFLDMKVALLLPLSMLLTAVVAIHSLSWFYPAMAVLLGAHYLWFALHYHLHGYRMAAAILLLWLAAAVCAIAGGFATGAWVTTAILLLYALGEYSAWYVANRTAHGETERDEIERLNARGARMPFRILAGLLLVVFALPVVFGISRLLHGDLKGAAEQLAILPVVLGGYAVFWNVVWRGRLSERFIAQVSRDEPASGNPSARPSTDRRDAGPE